MSFVKDFRSFALKGNVVDLAVGVVIGGAFGKIVTALVDDLVMPVVGAILPGGDWRAAAITPLKLPVGHLLGAVLDFLIIAAVLFFVVNRLLGVLKKGELAPATTRPCPECLDNVPIAARRCRSCAQALPAA